VFDRSWEFEVCPPHLWSLLSDTSAYSGWWPWLRAFEPVPLERGATTSCSIGPPLPYMLTVTIAVIDVVPEQSVAVAVTGDVAGPARLEIAPSGRGSSARLVWELEVRRRLLRVAAGVARPMLQWGHEWVVSNGVEQFRRAAINGRTSGA
jgi:hypothetical protein